MPVFGFAREPFGRLAESFAAMLAVQPTGGAALSLYVDGECVIDLHGGESSPGVSWTDDTLSLVYSNTKGIVAVAVATLVKSGVLDPDAPVVNYWPEFVSISRTLPVRGILEHRAGLSATRRDLTLAEALDHDTVIAALLDQEPLWEPGTGYAYHSLTFGNLVDELVRRVDGRTVAQLICDAIVTPLGIEAWLGLPAEHDHRVAEFVAARQPTAVPVEPGSPLDWQIRSMTFGTAFPAFAPVEPDVGFNSTPVYRAGLAGAGLITTARSMAQAWSAVVTPTNGARLLDDDTVDFLTERRVTGPSVWGEPGPWSDRGFGVMLDTPGRNPLFSPTSFGHDGYGGQAGWADRRHRAGFGFVTNHLVFGQREHERWLSLVAEIREVLERD